MSTELEELLADIEGLGASRIIAIVGAFPDVDALAAATAEELTALPGIGAETARRILHAATVVDDPKGVASFVHTDKRRNIPTDAQAYLVDTTGDGTEDSLLYPRDPDLDPQLVWKGKDAQDRDGLTVPIVPIYIQEKIDARVLVENLRNTSSIGEAEPELTLFDDFDGIPDPLDQIEFYKHEANWSNRMILGDALIAMTSLAEKEELKAKVQTIYIDPPYGVKFQSNWQVSTRDNRVEDGKHASRQPEQVRAFRDTWRHGVNSYLSYLRDRFVVSRSLLNASGSIFVQIGDENVHVVRSLLDEIFGPTNFIDQIVIQKTTGARTSGLASVADYILWYARDSDSAKFRKMYKRKELGDDGTSKYRKVRLSDGTVRSLTATERGGLQHVPEGARSFRDDDNLTSQSPGSRFPVDIDGRTFELRAGYWKTDVKGMNRLISAGRVNSNGESLFYIRYLDDFGVQALNNVWSDIGGIQSRSDPKVYVVQTATRIVERCVLMTSDPGDLVLDPTCGSGTTAIVAEKWGRRWITVDTSRVALALARQRLMGARHPYYTLADTLAGARAESRETGEDVAEPESGWGGDIRRGFVYRRAPHLMLSTIANCEDLDEPGLTADQREAAIRRSADSEILYDQPIEDSSIVRVTGPFTVESLSPHRTQDTHATAPETGGDFVEVVIDNLARAGVQNGFKDERLTLGWLEPHAGTWVHAVGGFTDTEGKDLTVAISVGPETGTVGREHIAEASAEGLRDVRADLLLVCAYAFDAGAGEQANKETDKGEQKFTVAGQRTVGRLRVLNVRVNADLKMADELKNTGAGNLFMVFGEPDVTIESQDDGTVTVTLNGLDIYDPNKGEVRPSEPADIACWFIDTNYDDTSFFVRHAYFTGGGHDPFEALKNVLAADIDLDAWSALYRTESLPFAKPTTGKIAVKAINHFGDEAMRVFTVD